MLKLQMAEKKNIEQQEHDIDMMWHQVLVEDVREKVKNELYTAIEGIKKVKLV